MGQLKCVPRRVKPPFKARQNSVKNKRGQSQIQNRPRVFLKTRLLRGKCERGDK